MWFQKTSRWRGFLASQSCRISGDHHLAIVSNIKTPPFVPPNWWRIFFQQYWWSPFLWVLKYLESIEVVSYGPLQKQGGGDRHWMLVPPWIILETNAFAGPLEKDPWSLWESKWIAKKTQNVDQLLKRLQIFASFPYGFLYQYRYSKKKLMCPRWKTILSFWDGPFLGDIHSFSGFWGVEVVALTAWNSSHPQLPVTKQPFSPLGCWSHNHTALKCKCLIIMVGFFHK